MKKKLITVTLNAVKSVQASEHKVEHFFSIAN